ncbi:MAG: ABC transporter ATP-binding protein/permease [Bacillales bacterium]|nr:ABC transporter ATP-binding protein/permease [Bacillales bacterium]
MIKLSNVSKFYYNNGIINLALKNINLTFNKGEIVAIVGESGSGKSTLLNVICGVDSYDEGEIYFNNEETSYFNQEDMDNYRKKNVAFIYQDYNIIDSYTVLENVVVPLLLKGMSEKEAKQKAIELIEKVGLKSRIDSKGINLSGGEKQRTVIARALASDTVILACDEITGNLDSKTGDDIISLIKEISENKLVLMVTHNFEQVKNIATRKIMISDGEVVEDTHVDNEDIQSEDKLKFTDNKLSFKAISYITRKNLKNTPKKTFFSSLVLLLVSFSVLFFNLLGGYLDNKVSITDRNPYRNTVQDRLLVYKDDLTEIDVSDFTGFDNVVKNSFMEDMSVFINNGYYFTCCPTTYISSDYVLYNGKAPTGDNEIALVFKNNEDINLNNIILDEKYPLGSDYFKEEVDVVVTGIYLSDQIRNMPICIVSQSLYKNIVNKIINFDYLNALDYMFFQFGDKEEKRLVRNIINYSSKIDKPCIYYQAPYEEIDLRKIGFDLFSLYRYEFDSFDLEYVYSSDYTDVIITRIDLPEQIEEKVYVVSIYTDDMKGTVSKIIDLGYSYSIPSEHLIRGEIEQYLSRVFFFISIASGLILSLVSFVIISRIYSYKVKEFAVFRSLGYLKKSMSKIVHIELTFIGIISFVSSVLFIVTIGFFNSFFAGLLSCLNIGVLILSFIISILLVNLIAYRFNKKLFKFSLISTLKEEGK